MRKYGTCTEKNQTGYFVSTGSGQTLQQAPKIPVSHTYYYRIQKNPILECLADQARQDPDWPDKNCTGSSVLDTIIDALESHGMLSII